MKYFLLFFLTLSQSFAICAQELIIKDSFHVVLNDLTAAQEKFRRNDYNGNPCALILLGLVDKSATFHGDVVHTEYKQGEWWVYMSEGSQYLKIKTDGNLPKEIEFGPLKKSTTYKVSFLSNTLVQNTFVREPLLPFYEKVQDEWKLGYLDSDGNIAIPARLDGRGTMFENGTARVEYQGNWYFIDKRGQQVKSPSWNYDGLHLVQKDNKFGYADKDGSVIIPTKYCYAEEFNEGRARVETDHNIQYITPRGDCVYSTRCYAGRKYNNGLALVADYYCYFIDTCGKRQLGPFLDANNFSEGLASVITEEGEKGYINAKGEFVISGIYGDSFSEGLAYIGKGDYINKKGKVVIRTRYKYCDHFHEGLAIVYKGEKEKKRCGYIDKRGRVIIPVMYRSAEPFHMGFARVESEMYNMVWTKYGEIKTYPWVWINKKGEIIKDKNGRPYRSEPDKY